MIPPNQSTVRPVLQQPCWLLHFLLSLLHLSNTYCELRAALSAVPAEGVLQAEKDFNLESHPEIEGVANLHVIKLMQSFKSKELVTERFAWRHYYW